MRRIVNAAIFVLLAMALPSCLQPPTSGGTAAPIGSTGPGGMNSAQMTYTPHPAPPLLQDATVDQTQSQALTSYLKNHRLPLVGAQVMAAPGGQRQVILFGYVASGYGKQDAENKANAYMKDASVTVVNRITIQPELANTGASPGAAVGGGSSAQNYYDPSLGSPQQYQQQSAQDPYSNYQSYQSQSSGPSMLSTIIPMLGFFGGSFGGGSGGMIGGPFGGFGTGYGSYGGMGYPSYPPSPGFGPAPPYPPYP
jgi:hypothetical protein